MLAITGASGKLGGATLAALLEHTLLAPSSIVAITSSRPGSATWSSLASKGVVVRHGTFDDQATLEAALAGCDRFFLVSSPHVDLDFNDAPPGHGRERHHRTAIDAAVRAGVRHLYYSSLAFGFGKDGTSVAGVMRAHLRTEAYLAGLQAEGKIAAVTVVREGLYAESWPLYLGYFDDAMLQDGGDGSVVVPVAGDGRVSWTAIADLGLANALIVTDPSEEWAGKTFYLSTPARAAKTLEEVAVLVSKTRDREVKIDVVGREKHVEYYVGERGMNRASVEWWVSSYEALERGECQVDDPTLGELLRRKGKGVMRMEEVFAQDGKYGDTTQILRS